MQPRFLKASVMFPVLWLASSGVAQAATIDIIREANNPHEMVYGIHPDTGVEGYELDGAEIGATFADNSTESLTWMADPSTWTEPSGETYSSINGFAFGDDISLFMSWQGFEITTTSLLTSLSIDLAPGNAVYDTTYVFDDDVNGGSTAGSSFGFEFSLYDEFSAIPGHITVAYSGIVNFVGAAAEGDLFTTMTIDFTGLEGGGLLGDLSFVTDLDALLVAGDLTPVPLSSSMTFLMFALLGLGALGYKRSNADAQPGLLT